MKDGKRMWSLRRTAQSQALQVSCCDKEAGMVETEAGGQAESGQRGDRAPRTQAVNLRCSAAPASAFSQLLPRPGKDLRNHPIRGNPPLWCPKYHSWPVVCIW